MPEQEAYKYWAFISYSHADRRWGKWLHRSLESRKLPANLVGEHGRSVPVPKRLYPVFRDREELSSASDLGEPLRRAMRQSRSLIVICSPRSAASRWVNDEIRYFQEIGRADRIYCLIADGEPNMSKGEDLHPRECFPPALRYRIEDGVLVPQEHQPIAADVREQGDGKRNALLKLISGILDIPFDRLRQRDVERRNRFLVGVSTVSAVLVILMALLAWVALEGRNSALDNQADLLFNSAVFLAHNGEGRKAAENLINALEIRPDDEKIMARLVTLLSQRIFPVKTNELKLFGGKLWKLHASPDKRLLVCLSDDGNMVVFDASKGERWTNDFSGMSVKNVAFNQSGSLLAIGTEQSGISVWDTGQRTQMYTLAQDKTNQIVALDQEGNYLAADFIWQLNRDAPVRLMKIPSSEQVAAIYFMQDPDSLLLVYRNGDLQRRMLDDELTPLFSRNTGIQVDKQSFSSSRKLLALGDSNGSVTVWDCDRGILNGRFQSVSRISEMQYREDELLVATVTGEVLTWRVSNFEMISDMRLHKGGISDIDLGSGGVLSASWDGTAQLTIAGSHALEPMRHDGTVYSVSAGYHSNQVYTGSVDGVLRQWQYGAPAFKKVQMMTNEIVEQVAHDDQLQVVAIRSDVRQGFTLLVDGVRIEKHTQSPVIHLAVSPDGAKVIWITADGKIQVAEKGKGDFDAVQTIEIEDKPWRILKADKWNRLTFQYDAFNFRLWDIERGLPVGLPMAADGIVQQIIPVQDLGLVLGVLKDNSVRWWDYATGFKYPWPHAARIHPGRVSYQAGYLFVTAHNDVYVYRVVAGLRMDRAFDFRLEDGGVLRHSEEIVAIRYSAQRHQAVTTSHDGQLKIWQLENPTVPVSSLKIGSPAFALDISPDGRWLAIGTQNGELRLLDSDSLEQIADPLDLEQALVYTEFDNTSAQVVAATSSGQLQIVQTNLHLRTKIPEWAPDFARRVIGVKPLDAKSVKASRGQDDWDQWRAALLSQIRADTDVSTVHVERKTKN